MRFCHVERLCAIKEMRVSAPNDNTRVFHIANFEREAEMLATLNQPAIPKIYDFFSNGGLIYLVLEFIDGEDLESFIDRQDASLHEHQPEPIVFRDLKPSNIMLRADGDIVLIEFGIARTFQPMQRGTMIGTEGYAPPEQYRGVAEPRGDIYALGATLHHLATRSDPRVETPFTFDQRPLRTLNPDLSEELEAIIMRALAYATADRFPSAAAMAQALIALRDGPQISVASPHVRSTSHTEPLPLPSRDTSRRMRIDDVQPAEPELLPAQERVLWAVQTGDEARASAVSAKGRSYIGSSDGFLYAISLTDGGIL
jgi:eukaryotic-like serine/threonine-protein kinase